MVKIELASAALFVQLGRVAWLANVHVWDLAPAPQSSSGRPRYRYAGRAIGRAPGRLVKIC